MRFRYRPDRDLAQRLSDLVDSLVVRRRSDTRGASPAAADRELDDLAALAEELSGISIEPHAMFSDRLHGDIVEGRLSQALSPAAPGWTITRVLTRALHPAAAALLLVAGFVAYSFVGPTPASAREILTRSDQAIAKLVKPGEVLFRRWRISEWIQDTSGAPARHVERYTLEWIDGADPRHATARTLTAAGRMYLAFANELEDGRYRPLVYYEAGFAEPEALLSVAPGRMDFAAAVNRFSGADRDIVEDYVRRGYLYEPGVSEHRFNNAILERLAERSRIPREVLSVDDSVALHGVPVYKVRVHEPVRMPFRWQHQGPPRMWLERAETVKYIARDSFLTLRTEESIEWENGGRKRTVRELVETRTLSLAEADSPFALHVPDGVIVRRQSAFEHLSQVVRTLQRAPAFLAQTNGSD